MLEEKIKKALKRKFPYKTHSYIAKKIGVDHNRLYRIYKYDTPMLLSEYEKMRKWLPYFYEGILYKDEAFLSKEEKKEFYKNLKE